MPLSLQTFPTVPEAAAALKAGGARYLGGGTLVVRASNEGDIGLDSFVRSTDAGLRRIEIAGAKVTLGASVTMAQIARHNDLGPIAPAARRTVVPSLEHVDLAFLRGLMTAA